MSGSPAPNSQSGTSGGGYDPARDTGNQLPPSSAAVQPYQPHQPQPPVASQNLGHQPHQQSIPGVHSLQTHQQPHQQQSQIQPFGLPVNYYGQGQQLPPVQSLISNDPPHMPQGIHNGHNGAHQLPHMPGHGHYAHMEPNQHQTQLPSMQPQFLPSGQSQHAQGIQHHHDSQSQGQLQGQARPQQPQTQAQTQTQSSSQPQLQHQGQQHNQHYNETQEQNQGHDQDQERSQSQSSDQAQSQSGGQSPPSGSMHGSQRVIYIGLADRERDSERSREQITDSLTLARSRRKLKHATYQLEKELHAQILKGFKLRENQTQAVETLQRLTAENYRILEMISVTAVSTGHELPPLPDKAAIENNIASHDLVKRKFDDLGFKFATGENFEPLL